jgi:hypothetical protein
MTDIIYNATKTSREFHASNAFCRINKGPVRSGKSVRCLAELYRRARQQAPAKDGIRYSKWVIGRKSYPQLTSTTIKTWLHWFPEKYCGKIKWDSPISHHFQFEDVDAEFLFMPFENERDVDKLKSLEVTGGYLNELQYLPEIILTTMLERCNSYPPKSMGAPITFSGVWADTNPPSTRHWIYELETKRLPSNFEYFHDIPAVIKVEKTPNAGLYAVSRDGTIYTNNPAADYIENLPTPNYYLNQIPALSDEEVKVTCMGEYGFTKSGKPVYPDYNDSIHYWPDTIPYNPNETLYMGWDFGLTPALILKQLQPDGRLAAIKEIVTKDVGVEKFAEQVVIPTLQNKFNGWHKNYVSIGDPAGVQRNQVTMTTPFETLINLGIITRPAKTNDLEPRISATSWFLRNLYNGKGSYLISKDCPQYREGFLGDYQYEVIKLGDTLELSIKPKPLKNFSSHIHDAGQYIDMHIRQSMGVEDNNIQLSGNTIY